MASEKVSFDLSGGLDEIVRYCIDRNTENLQKHISSHGEEDSDVYRRALHLNEKLKSAIDKYMDKDGKVTLYAPEIRRLVGVFVENEIFRTE